MRTDARAPGQRSAELGGQVQEENEGQGEVLAWHRAQWTPRAF